EYAPRTAASGWLRDLESVSRCAPFISEFTLRGQAHSGMVPGVPKSNQFNAMSLNIFSPKLAAEPRLHHFIVAAGLLLALLCATPQASAATLLFENLQTFASRLPVGDPAIAATNELGALVGEGPKDIAVADLNGDSR